MTQPEFRQLLQRYVQGDCNAEETRLIQRWYEKIGQDSPATLTSLEKEILEEKLWQHITDETREFVEFTPPKPSIRRRSALIFYTGIAASLLLLLAVSWYLWKVPSAPPPDGALAVFEEGTVLLHYTNHTNQAQTIALEDHSKVTLTPGSSISYPRHFTLAKREIQLVGDAFFEVAKNPRKPFFVYAGNVVTQVLGTSFWVKAPMNSKAIEVEVKTGRVSVYENKEPTGTGISKSKKNLINGVVLTPNQKVTCFAAEHHLVTSLVEKPIMVNRPAATVSFVYNDASLPEVLHQLEKGYAIEIVLANEKLKACTFTGDIAGMPLYEQLDLVCKATSTSYEVRGTRLLLSGEGCE